MHILHIYIKNAKCYVYVAVYFNSNIWVLSRVCGPAFAEFLCKPEGKKKTTLTI